MFNLLAADAGATIGIICGIVVALVLVMVLLVCMLRYKKCPSDKIMVKFRRTKTELTAAQNVYTAARRSLCLSFSRTRFWI